MNELTYYRIPLGMYSRKAFAMVNAARRIAAETNGGLSACPALRSVQAVVVESDGEVCLEIDAWGNFPSPSPRFEKTDVVAELVSVFSEAGRLLRSERPSLSSFMKSACISEQDLDDFVAEFGRGEDRGLTGCAFDPVRTELERLKRDEIDELKRMFEDDVKKLFEKQNELHSVIADQIKAIESEFKQKYEDRVKELSRKIDSFIAA